MSKREAEMVLHPIRRMAPAVAGPAYDRQGETMLKLVLSLLLMLTVQGAGAGPAGLQAPAEKTPPAQAKDAENPSPKRRVDVHGDPLPPDALARMGTTRLRQGDTVWGLAFSPDGKTLASGGNRYYGDDRAVCLWNVSTGQLLRSFRAQGHSIRYLAFSPDGKTLATAGGDETIRLWDVGTGKEVRRLGSRPTADDILAFSPDGRRLATTRSHLKGHPITLWDPATGEELVRLEGRENTFTSLAFAPDGKTLASLGDGPGLILWEVATGKEVRRITTGKPAAWTAVIFTPDGKKLATAYADHILRLWDIASGEEVRSFRGHTRPVAHLAFSADGATLISASWDKTVRFWDVATGKERRLPITVNGASTGSVAFSPGEKILAVGGSNNAIALWDMASGKELRPASGHQAPIIALAFSPDGEAVTSVSWDRTFRRWDARTGRELRRSDGLRATLLSTPILLNSRVYDAASFLTYAIGLSSDGRLLATGERDKVGHIHLWDVTGGKEIPFSASHPNSVIVLAISPDGRVVASGGWDKTVRLWDVATGKALHCLTGHQGTVYSVCFSPNGKWLASASGEGDPTVRVWDTGTGKELHRLRHETSVFVVAFSADGRTLAAAGGQYANEKPGYSGIVLWEMASGKERGRLLRRERVVAALAFSPDGRSLASASTDGTVHVWDPFAGGERGRFTGHQGLVKSLAFSSDSRRLVSGGSDTTALVWDLARLPAGTTREEPIRGEEREAVCKELTGADAERAYKTMARLAASPDAAAVLKERLRPIVPADAHKVAHWIDDLDSETFAAREQAAGELAKLGDRAESALRRALGKSPSLEARRRMEALLEMLSPISPELLFSLRAVEVLEHNGTPKARELLRNLAGGDAEARLTQEAKAALARLSRQSAP